MCAPRPVDDRVREILTTPPELAAEIIECQTLIAELPAGARVLEPSAGDGVLVRAVLARNPTLQVTAIEPNPTRTQAFHGDSRVIVIHTTIEEFSETLPRRFDAVVMNPPFALEDPAHGLDQPRPDSVGPARAGRPAGCDRPERLHLPT